MATQIEIPLEQRTFFYIPVHKYPRFLAQIEKLSRRSEKNGGYKIECLVFGTKEENGERRYEVYLTAPDLVIEGWQFVARLDHSNETGNVVRMLPNVVDELPVEYRTVAPNCDHCKINRLRRDTFVLRNVETGEYRQVGSTCLKDLFTTDPRMVAKLAEIMSYARETAAGAATLDDEKFTGLRNLRHIDLEEYLAYCAAVIRLDGGRYKPSAFGEDSTKMQAVHAYFNRRIYVLDEDRATVAEAMTWIEKLAERRDAGENLNPYEHNVLVIGEATMIEGRSMGIAASIIGCYKRNLQPKVTAPVEAPKPMVLDNMQGILDLFEKAGSRIQWPKITISFDGVGEIVISRAGPNAANPGSINVASPGGYGNNTWYGRLHRDGRWEPNRRVATEAALTTALLAFAADPAGVAASYGHKTGNCCFCHKGLTDERSAHVGYGEKCASNYALPYPTAKEMKAIKAAACSHDHKDHAHA